MTTLGTAAAPIKSSATDDHVRVPRRYSCYKSPALGFGVCGKPLTRAPGYLVAADPADVDAARFEHLGVARSIDAQLCPAQTCRPDHTSSDPIADPSSRRQPTRLPLSGRVGSRRVAGSGSCATGGIELIPYQPWP